MKIDYACASKCTCLLSLFAITYCLSRAFVYLYNCFKTMLLQYFILSKKFFYLQMIYKKLFLCHFSFITLRFSGDYSGILSLFYNNAYRYVSKNSFFEFIWSHYQFLKFNFCKFAQKFSSNIFSYIIIKLCY